MSNNDPDEVLVSVNGRERRAVFHHRTATEGGRLMALVTLLGDAEARPTFVPYEAVRVDGGVMDEPGQMPLWP